MRSLSLFSTVKSKMHDNAQTYPPYKLQALHSHTLSLSEDISIHSPVVPHIPHRDALLGIFNADVIKDVNWKVPQVSFPFTVALVSMESYAYHCLLGLVVSVGGLTESTVSQPSVCGCVPCVDVCRVWMCAVCGCVPCVDVCVCVRVRARACVCVCVCVVQCRCWCVECISALVGPLLNLVSPEPSQRSVKRQRST